MSLMMPIIYSVTERVKTLFEYSQVVFVRGGGVGIVNQVRVEGHQLVQHGRFGHWRESEDPPTRVL